MEASVERQMSSVGDFVPILCANFVVLSAHEQLFCGRMDAKEAPFDGSVKRH